MSSFSDAETKARCSEASNGVGGVEQTRPNCLTVCHSCVSNSVGRELSLVLRGFFAFFESSLSQNVHSDISI